MKTLPNMHMYDNKGIYVFV